MSPVTTAQHYSVQGFCCLINLKSLVMCFSFTFTDNGATDSLKEQEQKWTDLGIQQLQESPQHTGN